ncbi:cytochrome P450 [Mangrovihabitans endophyticus]|uniref:Cytochrome P450 n=1 Tax=Mangrovihabitans endophyticus TaxID=1751298 RepID=A0A8J3BVV7_9ACTN|nr:cytochrome P450 [Mangrovihabitans endophyticus]GGK73179.1 cytochrome P450 [Mangrovihabitans endophyticus]
MTHSGTRSAAPLPGGITSTSIEEFDLGSPETFARHDMSAFWRTVRAQRPVYRQPPRDGVPGFWVVSRFADITAVYRDNVRFTSEHGNVLVTLLAGGDSAAGRMLAVTDGQRHRDLRNVLLRSFSPRVLQPIAERVRANARRLLSEAIERGECDFARDVASQIPITTICDLLGVPKADRSFLLTLTKSALSSDERHTDPAASAMARNEILLYFGDLVEARRSRPGDDVISVLANSEIGGVPLSDDDVILNCYSLIIGGDETSRLTMIDSVATLATRPDEWRRLKEGDATLAAATEETLRWATPTMHFGRTTVQDVTVGGERIPAGEIVTLWHASANRDERVFDRPDHFDLGRTPNQHITFGHGPHFCLGAYLARVEISEMLAALRDLTASIQQTGPACRIYSNLLSGISSLPVQFVAESRRGRR